jgi:CRP-like cAMP-binding protein
MNDRAMVKENEWKKFSHFFKRQEIPAKRILLRAGHVSKKAFFIEKGCLRSWFDNNGKSITFQFFLKDRVFLQLKVLIRVSQVYLISKVLNLVLFKPSQKRILILS